METRLLKKRLNTFDVIQEAVKSEGYQVKSAKEVYIQANSNYCFVPVNGGKNILVLRGGNEFAAKLEKSEVMKGPQGPFVSKLLTEKLFMSRQKYGKMDKMCLRCLFLLRRLQVME